MQQFKDRVAVVTGAASGIGLAMAERFAAEGMKVVLADIENNALQAAAGNLLGKGYPVLAHVLDVSKPDQVEGLARATYDAFGAAHVICNNAGVEVIGAAWEHTLADWEWLLGVNLWSVIHGVRAFVPRMIAGGEEGHIVNTASMAGLTTAPFMSVYDVSKFGVVALTESLYKDFLATGQKLRASVVCPGLINTKIMQSSRNRPAELAEGGSYSEQAVQFRQALATGLSAGYDPSVVAGLVFDGIREEKFYIIPAQNKDGIKRRAEDVVGERNPILGS
jgi:NAD(P)-dependent dehydrogenase (short-subunit alcohol dehydrogenase family)